MATHPSIRPASRSGNLDPLPVLPREPWSDSPREDEEPLLDRTLRVVRNRKWIILQALVIIPALVLFFSLRQEKQYTATANLLFTSDQLDSGPVDPSRQAATNEELLQLPVIAKGTASLLGGRLSVKQIENAVNIDTTADSDIVAIHATASSPEVAAAVANRYGQSFLTFRQNADQVELTRRLQIYQNTYDALTPEEQQASRGVALKDRIDRLRITEKLRNADAVRSAELVQAAEPPTDPSSPKTVRNVILAVLLAGAFGLALAALLERLDRALMSEDELERVYGLPILARIPRLRSFGKRLQERSAVDGAASTSGAEAFRMLRANLRFFSVDRELRSILVASPIAADGKSTVATGLAMTMAQMGDSVVLVEADLHKAQSSAAFETPSQIGLSTVLSGAVSLDEALIATPLTSDGTSEERSLVVLRSGPVPPNASELLESNRMRALMAELEDRFGTVIIDSPPLSLVSDALALVAESSGVVVVSRLRHTTREAAIDFRNQLRMLNGPVLGIVSNFAAGRSAASYYYGR